MKAVGENASAMQFECNGQFAVPSSHGDSCIAASVGVGVGEGVGDADAVGALVEVAAVGAAVGDSVSSGGAGVGDVAFKISERAPFIAGQRAVSNTQVGSYPTAAMSKLTCGGTRKAQRVSTTLTQLVDHVFVGFWGSKDW